MKNIYAKVAEACKENKGIVVCTVVNTKGSTPRKIGAKMLVYEDGSVEGTIGGGEVERCVVKEALEVMGKKKPMLSRHDLLHQHSMCCGGTMDIYIEPIMKNNRLYIFGAGHTGQALARYAVDFQFDVVLIDDRKEFLDSCTVKNITKVNISHQELLPVLPFDAETFICIMTYNHAVDRDILAYCLKKPHAYLGMIGSRRKVEMTNKMFMEAGAANSEEIEAVDMPMGFSIGAEGPEEIAISILAKLLEIKNKMVV